MGRFAQPEAAKGSQRWIQYFIEHQPAALNFAIGLGSIHWVSPVRDDGFAEYRDQAVLDLLGLRLQTRPLQSFWPAGGPQWDALGLTESGQPVLVEAKAHVAELFSNPCGASATSRAHIEKALAETAAGLGAVPGTDWTMRFYQYANRLAHAYLLNELNGVRAHLVFLNFIHDAEVDGPHTAREWKAAFAVVEEALGIRGNVPRYVRHVCLEVATPLMREP